MQDPQKITQLVYEDPQIVDGFIKRNKNKKYNSTFINKFIKHLSGNTILDLGCGPGRDIQEFNKKKLKVTGLDLSSEMIKRAKKLHYQKPEPHFIHDSMYNLKKIFKPNSFDGIWASAVLLHVRKKNMPTIISGINYICKKNGVVMITLKQGQGTRLITQNKYGKTIQREFTFWKKNEFLKLMKKFKFDLIYCQEKKSSSKMNNQTMYNLNFILLNK